MSGRSHRSRRAFLRAATAVSVGATAGCLNQGPPPAKQAAEHRESLSKYQDVQTAIADGYRMVPRYERASEGQGEGFLGVPFLNPDVSKVSADQPKLLYYNLADDGTYTLLAAGWAVSAKDRDSPPSLFGKTFDGPYEGGQYLPRHYALVAWLFKENPDGMFARYNPEVTPPAYLDTLTKSWRALQPYISGMKAKEAGYTNTEKCVMGDGGGYGVPFVNEDVSSPTDPTKPPVLLYRLTSSWGYRLLGAEWYVPVDQVESPPSMFGQEFTEMPGHSPKMDQPRHYGLHVWSFSANPKGLFEPYNPAIRC